MSNIDDSISEVKAARLKLVKKVTKVAFVSLLIVALAALLYFLILSVTKSFNSDSDKALTEVSRTNGALEAEEPSNQPPIDSAERAAIQQQLSDTRQRLQQAGANAAFNAWRPEQFTTFQQMLENAYALYTDADYAGTRAALSDLNNAISQLENEYQAAFTQAYEQAFAAFSDGEISRARLLNTEALRINPSFTPALELQPRLEAYEEVQALWLQSQTARAENNPLREIELLESLLALDPNHEQAAERAQEVSAELAERAFLNALDQALQALDSGDLDRAATAINRAAQIDGSRAEIANARARLTNARAEQELAQIEQQLALFQEIDEWATVAMVASNALQKYPSHSVSNNALTQASAIVQTQAQLQRYIDSPQRLADLAVLQNAQEAVATAQRYEQISPRLSSAIEELQQLIETANQPVTVVLTSDNRTHVRVLGEGVVGTHSEYSFSLKPGTYQFEGRREGYRSKIITVVVEQSAAPIAVTLICDERI
ncbi:hypothetical protein CWE13_08395 [Aliidiomarina shirensis]|uniref:PEGA domain-containing protein n=1 Tax=Aliidiomarina shirensis TaxID=1048642 RepID=A0A432WSY7_9GAMM|nr:hypothetical protein [Aliidiomarina shirensis]RUO36857.1 hypothetical protein CWE13_08395 [Aliidiomarina shirensis]